MSTYRPGTLVNLRPEDIARELDSVGKAFEEPEFSYFILATMNRPPKKVVQGLVVLADGTNWNPGSGAGVYAYYGSAWHKLG